MKNLIHYFSIKNDCSNFDRYSVFFFIELKVFVHLTHLNLIQIGQTYLKFFVWLEHLIKIHLEYHKKYF